MRWDEYPGLSNMNAECYHTYPYKRQVERWHRRGEGNVITEAETGETQPQNKDCWQPPEGWKTQGTESPMSLHEEAWPC